MASDALPYWKGLLARRTTTLRERAERAEAELASRAVVLEQNQAYYAEIERLRASEMDALAWRGCAEQLAARLYVLNEAGPALTNFERMKEATDA